MNEQTPGKEIKRDVERHDLRYGDIKDKSFVEFSTRYTGKKLKQMPDLTDVSGRSMAKIVEVACDLLSHEVDLMDARDITAIYARVMPFLMD